MRLIPRLSTNGMLGINARNLDYIFPYNPRKHFERVDDKLQTKSLALEVGIPCPELYGVVRTLDDGKRLEEIIGDHQDFVIKPAHGSGGGGIVVITHRNQFGYGKADGTIIRPNDVRYYLSNVLSGLYSLGGVQDQAIIEYRVNSHSVFDAISYRGVPDIRVIVLRGVPVMSMLRLPTRASDGKANLHAGGIGVGVDIATGTTFGGVQHHYTIDRHPDTMQPIAGVVIPQWEQILTMSSRFFDILGMGYIGVDIVLDKEKGPMMLEVNARPGISIQIANGLGLLPRLRRVEAADLTHMDTAAKVAFAREHFAHNIG